MTQNITFTFNCKFQHFSPLLLSQPWPFKSSWERTTFWEGSILRFLPVHLPLLHHHLHLLPLPHLHLLPLPHLHLLHLQILLQGNHPLPKERDQMSWHRLLSTTTEYKQQVILWLWKSRNAELDENVELDDLSQFMKKMSKTQRKVADRLKDPIVDKTDKRKSNI